MTFRNVPSRPESRGSPSSQGLNRQQTSGGGDAPLVKDLLPGFTRAAMVPLELSCWVRDVAVFDNRQSFKVRSHCYAMSLRGIQFLPVTQPGSLGHMC